MSVPIVWVIGGPSSGKTTLSENITKEYGYRHVDLNALVEHEIEAKSERGNQFAAKINKGQMVPLTDLIPLVEEELTDNQLGLVIDGYPHNQADAKVLETSVGAPDLIIALDIGEETLESRRSAQGARATATPSPLTNDVQSLLELYAGKTMQIDGGRDPHAVFLDVMPNMATLNQNRE